MSAVSLHPITRDNWRAVVALKTRDDQRGFVASNVYSLAQAAYETEFTPRAIRAGDTLVGFTLFGCETPDTAWVVRLMIDAAYQHRGYGRGAMHLILAELRCRLGVRRIRLSFEPENSVAEALYRSLGFHDTGLVEEGEIIYELPVPAS
jgi:diamine N-acetyltransferase